MKGERRGRQGEQHRPERPPALAGVSLVAGIAPDDEGRARRATLAGKWDVVVRRFACPVKLRPRFATQELAYAPIDHPALPRIREVRYEEEWVYVFEDYVEGVSLDVLAGGAGQGERDVAGPAGAGIPAGGIAMDDGALAVALVDVADALAQLHERGIAHGAVRPDHVLVTTRRPGGALVSLVRGIEQSPPGRLIIPTPLRRVPTRRDVDDLIACGLAACRALSGSGPLSDLGQLLRDAQRDGELPLTELALLLRTVADAGPMTNSEERPSPAVGAMGAGEPAHLGDGGDVAATRQVPREAATRELPTAAALAATRELPTAAAPATARKLPAAAAQAPGPELPAESALAATQELPAVKPRPSPPAAAPTVEGGQGAPDVVGLVRAVHGEPPASQPEGKASWGGAIADFVDDERGPTPWAEWTKTMTARTERGAGGGPGAEPPLSVEWWNDEEVPSRAERRLSLSGTETSAGRRRLVLIGAIAVVLLGGAGWLGRGWLMGGQAPAAAGALAAAASASPRASGTPSSSATGSSPEWGAVAGSGPAATLPSHAPGDQADAQGVGPQDGSAGGAGGDPGDFDAAIEVARISQARAAAIGSADLDRLAEANSPGSPAWQADAELITRIAGRGERLVGLAFVLESATTTATCRNPHDAEADARVEGDADAGGAGSGAGEQGTPQPPATNGAPSPDTPRKGTSTPRSSDSGAGSEAAGQQASAPTCRDVAITYRISDHQVVAADGTQTRVPASAARQATLRLVWQDGGWRAWDVVAT